MSARRTRPARWVGALLAVWGAAALVDGAVFEQRAHAKVAQLEPPLAIYEHVLPRETGC